MNHHLAAQLPHCLLTSPLDTVCTKRLISLSTKAIFLDSSPESEQAPLSTLLEILQPFAVLHPDETSSVPFGYQLTTISTTEGVPPRTEKGLTAGWDPDHSELIDPMQLGALMGWLRAKQSKWIVSPLGVLPVVRAILNIHQFDPYLAEHYFRQFHPIYQRLDDADLTQLALRQTAGGDDVVPEFKSSAVIAYLKIERKLYRQYTDD